MDTHLPGANTSCIVAVEGLVKRFPGTLAVNDVTFGISRGSVHALVGENGAGKSTIIKMLSGVHQPDSGRILVNGVPTVLATPHQAQTAGIVTIHQERTLVDSLTALENIFLGREYLRGAGGELFGIVDQWRMRREVEALCDDFDFPVRMLDRGVGELPGISKQVVELIKALAFRAELVIMDEPTAGVAGHERDALFGHMRRLRVRGTSILWVTHHLEELADMADRVTVLRDGALVGEVDQQHATPHYLVRMMVGREVETIESLIAEEAGDHAVGEEVLRVAALRSDNVLKGVAFNLRRGEILGIGGLVGAERAALARALVGADGLPDGSITVAQAPVRLRSTADALTAGISYVPDERKTQGILADFSIVENMSIASIGRFSRFGLVDRAKEAARATHYRDSLRIRSSGIHQRIALLSGGNQQKVIIARALESQPRIVIFNEPTQGVDVGAKMEIYRLIRDFVGGGGAAIVIASELMELLGLSDRVLVLRDGRVAGEVPGISARGIGAAGGSSATRALEEEFMRIAVGPEGGAP